MQNFTVPPVAKRDCGRWEASFKLSRADWSDILRVHSQFSNPLLSAWISPLQATDGGFKIYALALISKDLGFPSVILLSSYFVLKCYIIIIIFLWFFFSFLWYKLHNFHWVEFFCLQISVQFINCYKNEIWNKLFAHYLNLIDSKLHLNTAF